MPARPVWPAGTAPPASISPRTHSTSDTGTAPMPANTTTPPTRPAPLVVGRPARARSRRRPGLSPPGPRQAGTASPPRLDARCGPRPPVRRTRTRRDSRAKPRDQSPTPPRKRSRHRGRGEQSKVTRSNRPGWRRCCLRSHDWPLDSPVPAFASSVRLRAVKFVSTPRLTARAASGPSTPATPASSTLASRWTIVSLPSEASR